MRIDAYMQVNQLYHASKPKAAGKSSRSASENDSLEISSFGKDYQIAKKAASELSDGGDVQRIA